MCQAYFRSVPFAPHQVMGRNLGFALGHALATIDWTVGRLVQGYTQGAHATGNHCLWGIGTRISAISPTSEHYTPNCGYGDCPGES